MWRIILGWIGPTTPDGEEIGGLVAAVLVLLVVVLGLPYLLVGASALQ